MSGWSYRKYSGGRRILARPSSLGALYVGDNPLAFCNFMLYLENRSWEKSASGTKAVRFD